MYTNSRDQPSLNKKEQFYKNRPSYFPCMDVLIACECSGIIRDAFTARGHNAMSCDLKPCSAPGKHYQGDVRDLLTTYFDIVIFHPVCTFLANSGNQWLFKEPGRYEKMKSACEFFNLRYKFNSPRVATENPIPHGHAVKLIGKYSQIIHPYYFGDEYHKPTCLWLKGLPKLIHIKEDDLFSKKTHVGKGEQVTFSSGKKMYSWMNKAKTRNRDKTSETRSVSFPGIAAAMAEQWG